MMDSIILRKEISELERHEWRFTLIDMRLILDSYEISKKESTRHKYYKVTSRYDRLDKRISGINEWEVPFSEELKKKALDRFMSDIRVIKWSEFKRGQL